MGEAHRLIRYIIEQQYLMCVRAPCEANIAELKELLSDEWSELRRFHTIIDVITSLSDKGMRPNLFCWKQNKALTVAVHFLTFYV